MVEKRSRKRQPEWWYNSHLDYIEYHQQDEKIVLHNSNRSTKMTIARSREEDDVVRSFLLTIEKHSNTHHSMHFIFETFVSYEDLRFMFGGRNEKVYGDEDCFETEAFRERFGNDAESIFWLRGFILD